MPLFNRAWKREFFWDGRARSLREQVLQPIQDPLEMHQPLTASNASVYSTDSFYLTLKNRFYSIALSLCFAWDQVSFPEKEW